MQKEIFEQLRKVKITGETSCGAIDSVCNRGCGVIYTACTKIGDFKVNNLREFEAELKKGFSP
jgi:hypothetical protein